MGIFGVREPYRTEMVTNIQANSWKTKKKVLESYILRKLKNSMRESLETIKYMVLEK